MRIITEILVVRHESLIQLPANKDDVLDVRPDGDGGYLVLCGHDIPDSVNITRAKAILEECASGEAAAYKFKAEANLTMYQAWTLMVHLMRDYDYRGEVK